MKKLHFTLLLLWISAVSVYAQVGSDSGQLREVIVSGKRSVNSRPVTIGKAAISPMDLPQSVSIIGQTVIRDQQALRLSDVVKHINGGYLATTRGNTQESFSARGYNFSNSNMFKNGARVNSGAMPEMSSLEKVEVLKGSAAILYGNTAPGGVLNMVTKQPKFEAGGELSFRTGSYGLYKPAFDIYGPFSSAAAYRLNGTYEKANSFRDKFRSTRYYINPSFLFKFGNKTTLLVEADWLYHSFTPDFGIGTYDNTKIPRLPRSAFFGSPWQYARTQQVTSTASLRHYFTDAWQLSASLSYQNYSRDYYSTERIQAAANGDWIRPLNKNKTVEDYYIAQANLNGKFKTGKIGHTLLIGADADRYLTQAYTYNQPTVYDTINIFDAGKFRQRTDIPDAKPVKLIQTPANRFGVYAQDLISVSDKVKLLAGLRWSYQDARPVKTTDLPADTSSKGLSKTDKAFSPRAGLVYKPFKTTAVFVSYANSFSINSGTDVYGNGLSPSIIDQIELGVKNDFWKGLLSANLTLYRIINNNLAQTAPYLADGITVNNNTNLKVLTGQTTSDGLEIDLSSQPINGLSILAGYSYNYMRYTRTPDATGNYVEGERLVNTPAHTANASIFYTFTESAPKGLKLGAGIFYTGGRYGGWNNTIGQTQAYSRLIPVAGFTTIDLSVGYTWRKLSILAKISNLTNTFNYYVHENYSINPIAPRQFAATISYRR